MLKIKKSPYEERDNVRYFDSSIDPAELEWHVDFEDREVEVIHSGGWKIQMDNEIPRLLKNGEKFSIKKFTWHRVIKGDGFLEIKVIKFP